MIILDGNKMDARSALHAELREKLCLPDYYGGNLDALNDCLGSCANGPWWSLKAPGSFWKPTKDTPRACCGCSAKTAFRCFWTDTITREEET